MTKAKLKPKAALKTSLPTKVAPTIVPSANGVAKLQNAPEAKLPAIVPRAPDPNQLYLVNDGRSRADLLAESALSPAVTNGMTALNFLSPRMAKNNCEETGINSFVKMIAQQAQQIVDGDLSSVETMLVAQLVSLNAGMSDMMHRAQMNRGQHLGAMETYMRLGLKCQAQARATAETLAEIKNPRPIFARNFNAVAGNQQVNNAAGPQQVNNGADLDPPRAEEKALLPNKILAKT